MTHLNWNLFFIFLIHSFEKFLLRSHKARFFIFLQAVFLMFTLIKFSPKRFICCI